MPRTADTGEIKAALRGQLAAVLYIGPAGIGDDANFADLGLDSILNVEFMESVNKQFGLSEKVDALYDHPTLSSFADYLALRVAS